MSASPEGGGSRRWIILISDDKMRAVGRSGRCPIVGILATITAESSSRRQHESLEAIEEGTLAAIAL